MLTARLLAVHDPERITREPPVAIRAERRRPIRHIAAEAISDRGPTGRVTDRVEAKLQIRNLELLHHERPEEVDHLRIHRRLVGADRLHADLVELPVSS